MAKQKFLDLVGLSTFKDNIRNLIPTKVSELENDLGFVDSGLVEVISDAEPTDQDVNTYWVQEY